MTTTINPTNPTNSTNNTPSAPTSNVTVGRRNRGNIPAKLDIPVSSLSPSSSAPSSEIVAAMGRITPQPSEDESKLIGLVIDKTANLSISAESEVEESAEIDPSSLQELGRLGEGAGGTVTKVKNILTGEIMAKKKINVVPDENTHRQILRELQFLRTCHSPNIVSYYGAFLEDNNSSIAICMEYCEGGSLDAIYKNVSRRKGRIGEKVLGKISEAVLKGLVYLYSKQIIHRDIKPSNIVVTRKGEIKICDFGVSGKLVASIAETFLGTSYYMAPERIRGQPYKVSADVWSLGLTIMEVAQNRFPFPSVLSPIELVTHIANLPAPELSNEFKWSDNLRDFLKVCLEKDGEKRLTPAQMLEHKFIKISSTRHVDLERWIKEVWEWN